MSKMPPQTDAFSFSPEMFNGGAAKLAEHYKRTSGLYQHYSDEMLCLLREHGSTPDLGRYMTRSAELMFGLQRELFNSCFGLMFGQAPCEQPSPDGVVTFQIDRSSEATDAQSVLLPSYVPLSSIHKHELSQLGGSAHIPAAHIQLTRSSDAPGQLFIALTDLQLLLTGPQPLPLGKYAGNVVASPSQTLIAQVHVELIDSGC